MKLAPFLALSALLHALALLCVRSHPAPAQETFIPATIVYLEESLSGSGRGNTTSTGENFPQGGDANGKKIRAPSHHPSSPLPQRWKPALAAYARPQRPPPETSVGKPTEATPFALPAANVRASHESGQTTGVAAWVSLANSSSGDFASSGSGIGQTLGAAGSGQSASGSGSGVGNGHGLLPHEARFTQAKYRETPKPAYPESARREGKEGRVLLRVLVDREGNSKNVEVSGSSGSETLDRAATEAIRRWRFSPAHYGDIPVESWVRIPIDFRLTDERDR